MKYKTRMNIMLMALPIMCIAVLLAGCKKSVNIEQRVDELYNKMSQEERIAQLKSMYMDELFNEQGQLDTINAAS